MSHGSTIRPDVLDAVRRRPAGLRGVAAAAGYDEGHVYRALRELLTAGSVVRERTGERGSRGPRAFVYRCAP